MRMSCNGCRVLRKGCSDKCSIRPCLEWMKSADSQANATVFLAKFYGRAGLLNLINAGPSHLRPAIFRSLLYEACGRVVNPIYGSVGLLWSGQWQLCQNAVEAVLKGAPITPIPTEAAANPPPIKGAYDIRHVTRENSNSNSDSAELNRLKPTRTRFKRSGEARRSKASSAAAAAAAVPESTRREPAELNGSTTSHDSTVSHPEEATGTSKGSDEVVENVTGGVSERENGDGELELELTLGLRFGFDSVATESKRCKINRGNDEGACRIDLGLD